MNSLANDLSKWSAEKSKTLKFQRLTVQSILNWANDPDSPKSFNKDFIKSLRDHVDSGKLLSQKQIKSIQKITSYFEIDVTEWV